ncbi:hypothetical protein M1O57_05220, partial [Dehalococcoidia bacterium]|nr:hypothetical protein [Dehalococcoidia bacterium]
MVSSKQGLKESQKTGPLNQLDAYRLKVAQGADNRRGFMRDKRSRDLAATPARGSLPRQGNMATLFKRSVRQAMSLIWPLGACQFQTSSREDIILWRAECDARMDCFGSAVGLTRCHPGLFPAPGLSLSFPQFYANTKMSKSPEGKTTNLLPFYPVLADHLKKLKRFKSGY